MISAILSGGENRRFPRLKGFIEADGGRIIETNLALLRGLTGQVVISTNAPEHYFYLGVPLIGDVTDSRGPMSGIYSVLACTGADGALVTACDMPFLNRNLLSYIISKGGGDVTVPVFNGKPEPLLAVYRASVLPVMEELIAGETTSLASMLDRVDTVYVDEGEVRRLDPEGRSFVNINTPEDYKRYLTTKEH